MYKNPGAQADMVGIIFKNGDGKIQENLHALTYKQQLHCGTQEYVKEWQAIIYFLGLEKAFLFICSHIEIY